MRKSNDLTPKVQGNVSIKKKYIFHTQSETMRMCGKAVLVAFVIKVPFIFTL